MGVFSNLDQRDIEQIVGQYDRGNLSQWSAISSGIENSNFLVELTELGDQTRYILTLIEVADFSRSQEVVDLMTHLKFYGCPLPDIVTSRSNQRLLTFRDSPVTLCTWLRGHHITHPTLAHCNQLGRALAQFHQVASAFRPPTQQPYDAEWLATAIDRHAAERSTMKDKRCIMRSRCTTICWALTCRLDGPTAMRLGITFYFCRTVRSAACSITFTLARILSLWISQLPLTTGAGQWLAVKTGIRPQSAASRISTGSRTRVRGTKRTAYRTSNCGSAIALFEIGYQR